VIVDSDAATLKSPSDSDSGFTLPEALVAVLVLTTGVIALASLFCLSIQANRAARATTVTTILAMQKIEQLRTLQWSFDHLGLPLTDTSTDVSVVPFGNGGAGLSASPPGSLQRNVSGYVDYLDANGNWVGSGAAGKGAVWVRRWSIEPLPADPDNTLILQVLVTRAPGSVGTGSGSVPRMPEEARLVSVRTRKTP